MYVRRTRLAGLLSLITLLGTGTARADPVGLESILTDLRMPVTDAQVRAWRRSSTALAQARRRLEKALGREPRDDTSRWALGRVLASLGDNAAAAAQLRALVERDLPRFGARVRAWDGLSAFRASPAGTDLLRYIDALDTEWASTLRQGLPVVARVEGVVRPGVWLASRRRFVPAAAPVGLTFAAMADPAHDRAFVASGIAHSMGGMSDVFLEITTWSAGGASTVDVAIGDLLDYVEVRSTAEGTFVRKVLGLSVARGRIGPRHWGPWAPVDAAGHFGAPLTEAPVGPSLILWDRAYWVVPAPIAGLELVDAQVRVPGRPAVALGSARADAHPLLPSPVVWTPDHATAVVVTLANQDYPAHAPWVRHRVLQIDLARGSTTSLDEASGTAALATDPAGAIYVQLGARLRQLDGPELPRGILLSSPLAVSGIDAGTVMRQYE